MPPAASWSRLRHLATIHNVLSAQELSLWACWSWTQKQYPRHNVRTDGLKLRLGYASKQHSARTDEWPFFCLSYRISLDTCHTDQPRLGPSKISAMYNRTPVKSNGARSSCAALQALNSVALWVAGQTSEPPSKKVTQGGLVMSSTLHSSSTRVRFTVPAHASRSTHA